MIKEITSTQNSVYKLVKSLKTKKARELCEKISKYFIEALEFGCNIDN